MSRGDGNGTDPQPVTLSGARDAVGHVELSDGYELVRSVALAANAAWRADDAFVTTVEAVCAVLGWPLAVLWRPVDDGWSPWFVHTADHRLEVVAAELRSDHADPTTGVLGAMLRTRVPASVWRLPGDGPGERPAAAAGLRTALAFAVTVDDRAVAVIQGFSRDARRPGSDLLAAMETVCLQLARVVERSGREEALRRGQAQLAEAQHLAGVGSWHTDLATGRTEWSPQLYRNLGLPTGAGPGTYERFLAAVHVDDREQVRSAGEETLATGLPYTLEHRVVLPDGADRWVRSRLVATLDADGRPTQLHGAVQDITDERALRAAIRFRAEHDELTGLPNRASFTARLGEVLDSGRPFVAAALDLRGFTAVNDRFGRVGGDQVLQQFAERLVAGLPESAVVARLGADEFAVLLPDVDVETGRRVLSTRFGDQLRVDGEMVSVAANAGLTGPVGPDDAEAVLRAADAALHVAKAQHAATVQVFDPTMEQETADRLALRLDLQQAIEAGSFTLHYQPVVSLHSGQLVGVEALLRWDRPGYGPVSPAVFVPLAEELGLVRRISRWVLDRACAQLADWRASASPTADGLTVAVNLSAQDLDDPELADAVAAAVDRTGIAADRLVLEVTETAIAQDAVHAITTLRDLRRRGVRLAIDDFGTGYSSLSRLRDFPFDLLKIDRSFLRDIQHAEDDPPILSALFAMASQLRLRVIAEGIETPAQLAAILRHGGEEAQGYLFCPPLDADSVARLLTDPTWDTRVDG